MHEKNDYLLYDGDELFWYNNKGTLQKKFPATSGVIGSQNSKFRNLADEGPVPEGSYTINLSLSSNREVNIDPETGTIFAGEGIERVPSYFTTSSGYIQNYSAWGNIRARLNTSNGDNVLNRNNFYLHNSHKGYTHGCIEISTSFFDRLINYSINNNGIKIIVNYPTSNTSTQGNTKY